MLGLEHPITAGLFISLFSLQMPIVELAAFFHFGSLRLCSNTCLISGTPESMNKWYHIITATLYYQEKYFLRKQTEKAEALIPCSPSLH